MKKIFLSLAITLALASLNKAKAQFELGTNAINMGIVLGSSAFNGHSSAAPGLAFSYEHGQWGNQGPGTISLGGYLGYQSYGYEFYPYYKGRTTYLILGFRGAYHYTGFEDKKWDPYGGLMLSYAFAHTNIDYEGYSQSNFTSFSLYFGGRYYLSDQWALNAELGFGIAALTLGASYRF